MVLRDHASKYPLQIASASAARKVGRHGALKSSESCRRCCRPFLVWSTPTAILGDERLFRLDDSAADDLAAVTTSCYGRRPMVSDTYSRDVGTGAYRS